MRAPASPCSLPAPALRPPRPCLAPSPLQRAPTLCLLSGRGGRLALFYDFNDPLSTPGEIPNLGTAGPDYNALAGKTDDALATAVALDDVGNEVPTLAPSFVAADAIPNKQEEPAAPLVVYALPGTTVDLAAHGLPAGGTYDAPADLNATVVLERAGTEVHVLPLRAPEVLDERHRLISAVEDSPVAIYLLPGPQHTWNRGMRPVVTRLPNARQALRAGADGDGARDGGRAHRRRRRSRVLGAVRARRTGASRANAQQRVVGSLAMAMPWPLCAHDWRICKRG